LSPVQFQPSNKHRRRHADRQKTAQGHQKEVAEVDGDSAENNNDSDGDDDDDDGEDASERVWRDIRAVSFFDSNALAGSWGWPWVAHLYDNVACALDDLYGGAHDDEETSASAAAAGSEGSGNGCTLASLRLSALLEMLDYELGLGEGGADAGVWNGGGGGGGGSRWGWAFAAAFQAQAFPAPLLDFTYLFQDSNNGYGNNGGDDDENDGDDDENDGDAVAVLRSAEKAIKAKRHNGGGGGGVDDGDDREVGDGDGGGSGSEASLVAGLTVARVHLAAARKVHAMSLGCQHRHRQWHVQAQHLDGEQEGGEEEEEGEEGKEGKEGKEGEGQRHDTGSQETEEEEEVVVERATAKRGDCGGEQPTTCQQPQVGDDVGGEEGKVRQSSPSPRIDAQKKEKEEARKEERKTHQQKRRGVVIGHYYGLSREDPQRGCAPGSNQHTYLANWTRSLLPALVLDQRKSSSQTVNGNNEDAGDTGAGNTDADSNNKNNKNRNGHRDGGDQKLDDNNADNDPRRWAVLFHDGLTDDFMKDFKRPPPPPPPPTPTQHHDDRTEDDRISSSSGDLYNDGSGGSSAAVWPLDFVRVNLPLTVDEASNIPLFNTTRDNNNNNNDDDDGERVRRREMLSEEKEGEEGPSSRRDRRRRECGGVACVEIGSDLWNRLLVALPPNDVRFMVALEWLKAPRQRKRLAGTTALRTSSSSEPSSAPSPSSFYPPSSPSAEAKEEEEGMVLLTDVNDVSFPRGDPFVFMEAMLLSSTTATKGNTSEGSSSKSNTGSMGNNAGYDLFLGDEVEASMAFHLRQSYRCFPTAASRRSLRSTGVVYNSGVVGGKYSAVVWLLERMVVEFARALKAHGLLLMPPAAAAPAAPAATTTATATATTTTAAAAGTPTPWPVQLPRGVVCDMVVLNKVVWGILARDPAMAVTAPSFDPSSSSSSQKEGRKKRRGKRQFYYRVFSGYPFVGPFKGRPPQDEDWHFVLHK
jgi:hypothetical protein